MASLFSAVREKKERKYREHGDDDEASIYDTVQFYCISGNNGIKDARENYTMKRSDRKKPSSRPLAHPTAAGMVCMQWGDLQMTVLISCFGKGTKNRKNLYIIFRVININIISWFFFCFSAFGWASASAFVATCKTPSDAIVDALRLLYKFNINILPARFFQHFSFSSFSCHLP